MKSIFKSGKGDEPERPKSKGRGHKVLSLPNQPRTGSISDESEEDRAINSVNTEFCTAYREPYDVVHSGISEHVSRYYELMGIQS